MSGTDLGRRPVRRALISVYDKTGLEELVRGLHDAGVELVSTGGSARLIGDLGLPVTPVEELTGFPECLEGRVKTLHPRVHAGILADTRKDDHLRQLAELEVAPFELVVVNLYPFTATVASGAGADECVEQIDIGGPSMVRAAAKNHPSVAVVVDPTRYADVLAAVQAGGFTLDERTVLAAQAFAHTAAYDVAVASWMAARHVPVPEGEQGGFPGFIGQTWTKAEDLRYGENPHQHAALYRGEGSGVASAELLHGKAMSFNNYVDTDAAVRAAHDHGRLPAVAVVKHANPCGIAVGRPGDDIAEVHRRAHECDPLSAFGGVIATNQTVTRAMAETVKDIFTEVVAAPDFEPEALEILRQKKNIRLLRLPADVRADATLEVRPISGGLLVQETDRIDAVVEPGEDDRPTAGHGDAPALDPRRRAVRRRPDPRGPRLRVEGRARRQVQRDPARQGRRLRRHRHGAGEPGRLLPPRGRAGRERAGPGCGRGLGRLLPLRRRPADPARRGRAGDRRPGRVDAGRRDHRRVRARRGDAVLHRDPPLCPLTSPRPPRAPQQPATGSPARGARSWPCRPRRPCSWAPSRPCSPGPTPSSPGPSGPRSTPPCGASGPGGSCSCWPC